MDLEILQRRAGVTGVLFRDAERRAGRTRSPFDGVRTCLGPGGTSFEAGERLAGLTGTVMAQRQCRPDEHSGRSRTLLAY